MREGEREEKGIVRHQWLMPVVPATQEEATRRITV
jgi:hypothetical protein